MSIQNGYYLTVTANGTYSVSGDSAIPVSGTATASSTATIYFSSGNLVIANFTGFGYLKLWVFYA